MRTTIALLLFALTACDSAPIVEVKSDGATDYDASMTTHDASVDAARDAGHLDASVDATVDAATDAEVDAYVPPVCECSIADGACCDGCHIMPANTECSPPVYVSSYCANGSGTATPLIAWTTTSRKVCDGVSPACTVTQTSSTPDYCQQAQGYICRVSGGVATCS